MGTQDRAGGVTLCVASTGGHLAQLVKLRPRMLSADSDVLWVTFDTVQSRSILAGENVIYATFTAPRDWRAAMRNVPLAVSVVRRQRVTRMVSTGSAIALSFIPAARAAGVECHYIESAARSLGPSLTGRFLRRVPGVALYTQYPAWARPPWSYRGSVFDGFAATDRERPARLRVVVMLGTIPYPFPRLIERVREIVGPDADVLWQVGATEIDAASLPGTVHRTMPHEELQRALAEADVVIAHAGIGSALAALEAGLSPILVPRDTAFAEHVDDHQRQIASELERRGLALQRSVEALRGEDLELAAARRILTQSEPPEFRLDGFRRTRRRIA